MSLNFPEPERCKRLALIAFVSLVFGTFTYSHLNPLAFFVPDITKCLNISSAMNSGPSPYLTSSHLTCRVLPSWEMPRLLAFGLAHFKQVAFP